MGFLIEIPNHCFPYAIVLLLIVQNEEIQSKICTYECI